MTAVTDAEFASLVLAAPLPVLVDVWAAWCAPCVTLKPVMERLSAEYADRLRVMTVDADAQLEIVTRHDVRALPTILLFDHGALVARQSGAQSLESYRRLIDAHLARRSAGAPSAPLPFAAPRMAPAADAPATREARALVSADEPLVIFKHSATCIVSQTVKRQFDDFVRANPQVATRLVIVQQERALSNALEDVLQVTHESPQALVVHRGHVLWHGAHRRITAERLEQAVALAAP